MLNYWLYYAIIDQSKCSSSNVERMAYKCIHLLNALYTSMNNIMLQMYHALQLCMFVKLDPIIKP